VVPEPYLVSYEIEGQRYRFDYRLAFDLALGAAAASRQIHKPKGSLLTLSNIIKYRMTTLVIKQNARGKSFSFGRIAS
jgi:hypothetical protein